MADLRLWIRNEAGKYAGELEAFGTSETIADVQARLEAGLTALDKKTNARPPNATPAADPRSNQAKAKWAAAPPTVKNDAMVALALALGIEDPV